MEMTKSQAFAHTIKIAVKAKNAFGQEMVNQKVNTIIKEVLSFLPLDDYIEHAQDESEDVG